MPNLPADKIGTEPLFKYVCLDIFGPFIERKEMKQHEIIITLCQVVQCNLKLDRTFKGSH